MCCNFEPCQSLWGVNSHFWPQNRKVHETKDFLKEVELFSFFLSVRLYSKSESQEHTYLKTTCPALQNSFTLKIANSSTLQEVNVHCCLMKNMPLFTAVRETLLLLVNMDNQCCEKDFTATNQPYSFSHTHLHTENWKFCVVLLCVTSHYPTTALYNSTAPFLKFFFVLIKFKIFK